MLLLMRKLRCKGVAVDGREKPFSEIARTLRESGWSCRRRRDSEVAAVVKEVAAKSRVEIERYPGGCMRFLRLGRAVSLSFSVTGGFGRGCGRREGGKARWYGSAANGDDVAPQGLGLLARRGVQSGSSSWVS